MGENSKIEWTDHTFNPWIGCTKVSPGCQFCYAESQNDYRQWNTAGWGPTAARKRTSPANWKKPIVWDREAAEAGQRRRVFCASLADVFDDHSSIEPAWRSDLFKLIDATPNLDWLLLTKRPHNVNTMIWTGTGLISIDWLRDHPNVWVGTSVENQTYANERIRLLLKVPSSVRFLSCEPLLGPVNLTWLEGEPFTDSVGNAHRHALNALEIGKIDWVIVGGESGPHARPMHPQWARSLRDQCQAAGVAFHFKQWGEYLSALDAALLGLLDGRQYQPHRWSDETTSFRVGKHKSGRLLDGREWNEFPSITKGQSK